MRKIFPLLLFCSFYAVFLHSQEERPSPLLNSRDTLLLTVEGGKKFIHHPIKSKQTLFSISRYYNLGLDELFENNPSFRTDPTLRTGSYVKIPIPNKAIKRYKGTGFVASKNASIYYVVQRGDNLFQISKRYFEMPVDSVAKRNRLKGNAIKPGQRLLIGWMGTEGMHTEWRTPPVSPESEALKSRFQEEKKNKKETSAQGVCF